MITLDDLDPELAASLQGLADKLTAIGQEAKGKEIIDNALKDIEQGTEAAALKEDN